MINISKIKKFIASNSSIKWLRNRLQKRTQIQRIQLSILDGNINRAVKIASRYFNKLGFNDSVLQKYLGEIPSYQNSQSDLDSLCKVFQERISRIDDGHTYGVWLDVSRIFTSLGFLRVGYLARKKAIGCVLTDDKQEKNFLTSLQAYCERHRFTIRDSDYEWLRGLPSDYTDNENLSNLLSTIVQNQYPEIYPQKSQFSQYLNNRTVALVGPSQGCGDNEAEINSFDVVARVGYAGPASLSSKTGNRTDVSFYQGHKIGQLLKSESYNYLNELSFALLLHCKHVDLLINYGVSAEKLVCSEKLIYSMLFNTKPNAGLELLHNCLGTKPKALKIFNMDLFLTRNYPEGYIHGKTGKGGPRHYCINFSKQHYPVAQFNYYKSLWSRGIISGDDAFESIMEMSEETYIDELQRNYGIKSWAQT